LNFSNKLLTFQNDWSGFSGTLDTGASTGNIRINSTAPWNFGAAVVNLGNAKMYHNVNGLFNITFGALNGGPSSQLSAGGQAVAGSDIYTIGGLNQDCLFAGAFADGGTGHKLAITKTGSGKLTLAGSSTHTGATTLSAGTLVLNGSLGATATTLASGTTLAGTGSSGGLITASSGSTISPGATAGAVGTLTSAGLTLAGTTTLSYDLSNSSVTGNDRITVNGGTLTLSSATVNFNVNMLNGVLASGTYNLIDGTAAMAANPAPTLNLVGLPAGARQTFSLARAGNGVSPGFVNLVVAGSPPASLVWSGANSGGLWDLNTTENFTGGATNTFYNLDSVTFDDTSTVGTVTLAGIVQPRTLTFSNSSRAYTLTGAGSIGGNTSLVKTGSATLTLESANTYTGGTTIGAGSTIQLANDTANAGALGTGPITMLGGTLSMFSNNNTYNGATYQLVVPAGQSGTFNADGRSDIYGTLTGGGVFNLRLPWLRTTLFTDWSAFTGTLNVINSASGGDLRMGTSYGFPGFPNAIVNLGAYCAAYYTGTLAGGEGTTISFGTLSGPSNSYLLGGSTGGRAITYRIGGRGTDAIFAGIISEQNTATSTSYVKTGTGMWTLGGSGAWNGGTTVEQGILKIAGSYTSLSATNVLPGATLQFASGSLTTDAVNIASGAFFSGNGIITGDLNNDGTVTSTLGGDLTVTGDVVNNGIMRIASGTSLTATGNFVNNGVLDLLTGAQGLPPNLENNGIVIDSSSLGMSGVSKSGNALTVSVPTYDGHFYQLQRSFSLNSDWADVGSPQVGLTTVAGAPTLRTFTDSSATADKGFYRVKVTP
jgi:autotransporter-associated beta strand protein